jgi:hypothetical protein
LAYPEDRASTAQNISLISTPKNCQLKGMLLLCEVDGGGVKHGIIRLPDPFTGRFSV